MGKRKKNLVTLTFKGSRFDDHGLDLDSLHELITYKRILLATAKELWLRNHPKAKSIPKEFDEQFCLKFYEIKESSAEIPIFSVFEVDDEDLIKDMPDDEFDEAASLIAQVTKEVSSGFSFPEKFPKHILPQFKNFGDTLRADEWIEQKLPTWAEPVVYSRSMHDSLHKWFGESYQDIVERTGEVRSINLDSHMFSLALEDGKKISVSYDVDQEQRIIDALYEHSSKRLKIKGKAEYSSLKDTPNRVISIEELWLFDANSEEQSGLFDKPIWEIVSEIGASVPIEDWEKVPSDLSENLDHYLYGIPEDEEGQ